MTPTVRRLVPADADAYVLLRKAMLLDTPTAFKSSPDDDRASNVAAVIDLVGSGDDAALFGAFAGSALVGAAGLRREPRAKVAHRVYIWGVHVAPSHRRQGFGRALLEAALVHAASIQGVVQVDLSVSATGHAAYRLYESLGFRSWGTEPRALCVGGQFDDEHHMALRLPSGEAAGGT